MLPLVLDLRRHVEDPQLHRDVTVLIGDADLNAARDRRALLLPVAIEVEVAGGLLGSSSLIVPYCVATTPLHPVTRLRPPRVARPAEPLRRDQGPTTADSSPASRSAVTVASIVAGATTTTIPSPNVARTSSSPSPPSAPTSRMTDGIRQLSGSSRAPRSGGSARGTLPGSPPPVMWANPRTS